MNFKAFDSTFSYTCITCFTLTSRCILENALSRCKVQRAVVLSAPFLLSSYISLIPPTSWWIFCETGPLNDTVLRRRRDMLPAATSIFIFPFSSFFQTINEKRNFQRFSFTVSSWQLKTFAVDRYFLEDKIIDLWVLDTKFSSIILTVVNVFIL